jgi:hypothetical protein
MTIPTHLRGLSPFAIDCIVAEHLKQTRTPAMSASLKLLGHEELTNDEHRALKQMLGFGLLRRLDVDAFRAKAREVWITWGRRSGKTSIFAASAAVAAVLSPFEKHLGVGEVGRVIVTAPKREQTRQFRDAVHGILTLLGVPHTPRGSEIEVGRALVVTSTADEMSGRSGTAILAVVDECAFLPTEEGSAGRDVDVIASVKPTLATIPTSKLLVISSPWRTSGVHFETTSKHFGKVGPIVVLKARTEQLNHLMTRAAQERSEPDARARELAYGCEATDDAGAWITSAELGPCIDAGRVVSPFVPGRAYAVASDPATRGDAWVNGSAHREYERMPNGGPLLDRVVVDAIVVFEPAKGRPIDYQRAVAETAGFARRHNAEVVRDSYMTDALGSDLLQRGVSSREVSMAPGAQAARFVHLRNLIRARRLRLPDHPLMRKQLLSIRETRHDGGRVSYAAPARRNQHDDIVDMLALLVEAASTLPVTGGNIRRDVSLHFDLSSGLQVQTRWFEEVVGPGGHVFAKPVAPPPGTVEAEVGREVRQADGARTPDDEREQPYAPTSVPVENEGEPAHVDGSAAYIAWAHSRGIKFGPPHDNG